jgi:hypothetical protein
VSNEPTRTSTPTDRTDQREASRTWTPLANPARTRRA